MKKIFLTLVLLVTFSTSLFSIDDISNIKKGDFFNISEKDIDYDGLRRSYNRQLDEIIENSITMNLIKPKKTDKTSKSEKEKNKSNNSISSRINELLNDEPAKKTNVSKENDMKNNKNNNNSNIAKQNDKKENDEFFNGVKILPQDTEVVVEEAFVEKQKENKETDSTTLRKFFLDCANKYVGTKYVYGGNTPKGFDCSGYVQYVAKNGIGIELPHNSQQIYNSVQKIKKNELKPGDLVFFKSGSSISHVGIYTGKYEGKGQYNGAESFLNAANAGPRQGVVLSFLTENYWKRTFYAAGRIISN